MNGEHSTADASQVVLVWIAKCAAVVTPASILPRIWTAHPHVAFGLGLAMGITVAHLIPPRGKTNFLYLLLALAVAAAIIESRL